MREDAEWDEAKRQANFATHQVDFPAVITMFDGPVFLAEDERSDYGERRYRAMGDIDGQSFMVVYTWRGERRRIISAWRISDAGRRRYQALFSRAD